MTPSLVREENNNTITIDNNNTLKIKRDKNNKLKDLVIRGREKRRSNMYNCIVRYNRTNGNMEKMILLKLKYVSYFIS